MARKMKIKAKKRDRTQDFAVETPPESDSLNLAPIEAPSLSEYIAQRELQRESRDAQDGFQLPESTLKKVDKVTGKKRKIKRNKDI